MNLKINLKDPKFCFGCPLLGETLAPEPAGFWCVLNKDYKLEGLETPLRPQRCIKENGE